jgi:plastocyanin
VLTLALAVAGCGDDDPPTTPTTGTGTAVSMTGAGAGGSFNPTTLTTTVGSTVVWTNTDNEAHTTTSNTGLWNSSNVAQNGTFSFQFTTTGTFQYRCTLHANMNGTVIVQ